MRALALSFLLAAAAAPAAAGPYTRNVAIVVFEGVEVLDLAAPAEVFQYAGRRAANGDEPAFNVYTIGSTRTPVASQGFLDVTPDYAVADSPKPDILVIPGGRADNAIADTVLMDWIRTQGASAEHVLTICYGSFIAGRAGLLDGLEATTWYGSVERLGAEFPRTRALAGRRFVDNGKVITTAGVSAGLDGSLHLLARLLGRYVADRTAEYMEYPWSPEAYVSAKYPQANPRLDASGRARQQAEIALRDGAAADALALYRLVKVGRGDAMTLYNLGCRLALEGRRDDAIEAVSRAVEAGMRTRAVYEGDADLASLREDPRFRSLMAGL